MIDSEQLGLMDSTEDELDAISEYMVSHPDHLVAIQHVRDGAPSLPSLSFYTKPSQDLLRRLPDWYSAVVFFGSMLKDVPIFMLDSPTYVDAVLSLVQANEDGLDIDALDLPPLPFPTIAIEAVPGLSHDGTDISGIIITEVTEGEEWGVVMLLNGDEGPDLMFASIRPGHMVCNIDTAETEWAHLPHSPLWNLSVQAAHLITARGVEHEKLPRPQRREFERKAKRKYPQAFVIKIGTTSAHGASDGSGRTLTCRFMVRGHWRHYETKKTWVRPYIKGPANAPWRAPLNPVRKVAA